MMHSQVPGIQQTAKVCSARGPLQVEAYLFAHVPQDQMVLSSICHQLVAVLHQPLPQSFCICFHLQFAMPDVSMP